MQSPNRGPMPWKDEKPSLPRTKRERTNISNLPQGRLDEIRGKPEAKDDAELSGPLQHVFNSPQKGKKRPQTSFFTAWQDNELVDLDFTTEIVIAEKGPEETFEILAQRDYETLLDYNDQNG